MKIKTKLAWTSFSLLFLTIVGVYSYTPQYVPEGIRFLDRNFGGLSVSQVKDQLMQLDAEFQQNSFEVVLDEHEPFFLTRAELGISFDIEASLLDLIGESTFLSRFFPSEVRADNDVVIRDIQPSIEVDENTLSKRLLSLLENHEQPSLDASLEWNGDEWAIIPEQYGEEISKEESERAKAEMINNAYPLSETPIHIQYQELNPALSAEELKDAQHFLNSFIANPMKVVFGDEVTQISFSSIEERKLLSFDKATVQLEKAELQKWIIEYTSERNKLPGEVTITGTTSVESEYDHESYTKAEYEGSFESGWQIDEKELEEEIVAAFSDSERERSIGVEVKTIPPTILSSLKGISFPDLLSVGKSNFEEGNSTDRVKNITLSLEAFNAVIVPPGEEFSLNRATGWITPSKGYTRTKVLYGGTVGYGIGGGVCQTSTTLYRAVVHAGLSVTERRAHTLDVSYYHKYGYGIDAAVYTVGRKDFKFVNDTENPILINTYTLPNDEAVVEIYGTSDGRIVELENIPTGVRNYKKWNWNITKNAEIEKRFIESRYLR